MGDLERAREIAHAALASLERSRQRIDDLNVYPVPDGDTGTNMTLTARAVVEQLDTTKTDERGALMKELTRAALMGARGNSGVILSQIVRGVCETVAADGTLAQALRAASDAAYRAVREPVEGTMLSVVRELAEEAEAGGDLAALVRRGEEAVARTREQLDVLRDAGVVDAGGAGLLELVRGVAAAVSGEAIPEPPAELAEVGLDAIHQELSRYRYCTTFLIEGDQLDAEAIERQLEQLGDSLLVVGDREALKVHVHTDEPGRALGIGTAVGVIDRVEIANMHEQTMQREERLLAEAPSQTAVVAVVAGDGNRRLFESLGVTKIVEGGQTMNPPASELLAAVEAAGSDEVVLLSNNGNIVLAAEQAARLSDRNVHVVPTRSLQAGLAALVAFNPEHSAEENAGEMREALAGVVTGEVTIASRDAAIDGVKASEGDYLGLLEEHAVAAGPGFVEVAHAVTEGLLAEPRDVLTILTGANAPPLDGLLDDLAEQHPGLEIDVHEGGQPHYPLLLSAE